MRKYMTKEVTFTNIFSAEIKVNEQNAPYMHTHPVKTVIGNLNKNQAEKIIRETHSQANVYNLTYDTVTYEMEVEEFIKHATIKEDETNDIQS